MNENFENFLKNYFMQDYHGTDDESPDAFDMWIESRTAEDMIVLAQAWGESFQRYY
jgi:hypothetical protein